MLQKKICMLGAFAVGKTSLVSRFVHSLFSERYLTTVGVKIDKKVIQLDETEVMLLVWDLHGEDDLQEVRPSYLRGMDGYILVSDVTRPQTLPTGLALHERARGVVGDVPCIFLVNKCDLLDPGAAESLVRQLELPMPCLATSAREGSNVEAAFRFLAQQIAARTTP